MTRPNAEAIEALLAGLAAAVAVQERLATLVEKRTTALRRADGAAMAAADQEEAAALREAVALEQQRRTRTAALAAELGLAADAPLAALAEALPPPLRERVATARTQLREAVADNGRRAAVAARAAKAAAKHVDQLLRRVTERSAGASGYGASGRHAPARHSLPRMSVTA